jgi:dTMP kinase
MTMTNNGKLIVIEGPDNVGRTMHSELLSQRLEANGVATAQIGLLRSPLLKEMMPGGSLEIHILNPRTRSLLYATDLFDQILHHVNPLLDAGFVVIADRYTMTPKVREMVRGGDVEWISSLYKGVPEPDITVILDAGPKRQLGRLLYSEALDRLNYFEAGMDFGDEPSITRSYLKYQRTMRRAFAEEAKAQGCRIVSTKKEVKDVHEKIWQCIFPAIEELIIDSDN